MANSPSHPLSNTFERGLAEFNSQAEHTDSEGYKGYT